MTNIIECNDYKILNELAKRTFGTVYLCVDKNNNKCCVKAIQIRQKHFSYDHIELIKHAFVFIVTEYIPNGTLARLIKQHSETGTIFSEKDILTYFCDILLGLEYLHLKHVVHGDLKTENILIAHNGLTKIADFGVSRCLNQPVKLNTLSQSTPLYTAPEALFDVTKFSFSSDIWSLGCVFYELCMLHHPFHRSYSLQDLYDFTTRGIYQPINYKAKNYDRSMLALSEMMLESDFRKQATISKIVTQPAVMIKYYENYFNYDDV